MSSIAILKDSRIPLPPVSMIAGDGNEVALLNAGMSLLDLPRRLGLWSPDRSVVDLGCGNGRLAYGLLQKGQRAPYFGVDTVIERVDWLRFNLLLWLPDESNITLMDGGVAIPWPSWEPGLVVMHELSTRSRPDELRMLLNCLGERLPGDATACLSLFLLNKESRDLHMRKRSAMCFASLPSSDEIFVEASTPAGLVAHDEGWLHEQFKNSGLKVDTILYGGWCGRTGTFTHHDMVALRRA